MYSNPHSCAALQFRPIGDINSLAAGSILDLIGVVESCEQPVTLTRKDGTEATKRSMTLRDTSKASIELTLWGQLTEDPGAQISQVHHGQVSNLYSCMLGQARCAALLL